MGTFAAYFVIVSLMYTIIFSFLPHIIEAVKNKFEEKKENAEEDGFEMVNCDDVNIHVRTLDTTSEHSSDNEPFPISAYVTLVWFFQVASLVHIGVHERNNPTSNTETSDDLSKNALLKFLFDFSNFRMAVYRRVCPMDDLTLPVKELINVGLNPLMRHFTSHVIKKFFLYR